MPTQEQLDARLSPTAATLNLPAGGEIFRLSSNIDPTGSNGIYYRDPSGKLLNLDWATLAAMKYGPNATQLGGALNFQNGETIGGQTALKELFGIDFNQIAQKNYNDLPSLGSVGKLDPNTFKSLFSSYSAPTTSGNVTVNTTPNQLAPGVQSGVQPATIGVGGISYDANLMNKDYLRPGETPEQYATRTAQNSPGYQASTTGTPQVGPISSASMTGSSTNFKTPADYASLYGLTAPEQQAQRYITDIQGLNNQYAQKGAYESQVGSELGLNAAEGRVNALAKEQQAIPLQIQQNFEGRGVTKAGLQPIETGALRNNAIASLAASTQLADIRRTFEEEVKAKFGPIEAQIAAAKDNLQLIINSPEYSAADKKRAQTQLDYQNQKEAAILQQKDAATKIENLAMEASLAGAPDIALDKIRQAKDPIEAARIAAPYLAQKEASWSEPYMLGGDYVQRNNATGEIRTAVNVDKGGGGGINPGGTSSDPFIQSLYNTAGGKPITDTQIQSLNKGLTVLGQLGVLQSNISGTNTGPIVGAFRGVNPWDTNAQTIKAQLNAVVPNLARGVYGEVGVLTDNDIRTYSQTLPNLTSTEAVRNAVLYITLDMIGKSIKNTLSVNAAAGRDVSGFVDIYTEMEKTKNSILASIPGAKAGESSAPAVPFNESELQGMTFSDGSATGALDSGVQSFFWSL